MTRTTISLPQELARGVQAEARRRRSSVSEVIRGFIVAGLGGGPARPREIPWAGLVDDGAMAPASDMDRYLADHWADDLRRDR